MDIELRVLALLARGKPLARRGRREGSGENVRHQSDAFRRIVAVHRSSRAAAALPAPPRGGGIVRVMDLMLTIIGAAGALRSELEHVDAAAVRELMPEVEQVTDAIEALMDRLTS